MGGLKAECVCIELRHDGFNKDDCEVCTWVEHMVVSGSLHLRWESSWLYIYNLGYITHTIKPIRMKEDLLRLRRTPLVLRSEVDVRQYGRL